MVKFCAAFGCKERGYFKNAPEHISFHCFPKDPMMLKKWCIAVRRKDFQPSRHSKLCSKHFESHCYCYKFGSRQLKKDAVPTIFNYNLTDKMTNKKHALEKDTCSPSQTEQTTDSPLVVKLFPRHPIEDPSESEDAMTATSSKSSFSETSSEDITSLTACVPSLISNYQPAENEKQKNLTIYINKMYCCTPKSDLSNTERGYNSVSSTYSNASVKRKLDSIECNGNVNNINNSERSQPTLTKLTDECVKPNHEVISYKPFTVSTKFLADNLAPESFDQGDNNFTDSTVKVSMHVNKYVFSKGCNLNASDNSRKNNISSDSDSKLDSCSIEDFTISDMEDPTKAKTFFQLAKAKIVHLEKEISQLQKS